MSRVNRFSRLIAVIVLALVASGCAGSGGVGADLFTLRCASCHGGEGAGGVGPAVGPGSAAVELTDGQLDGVIRVGPGAMPSFDTLTDVQIASLVDYIRELQAGP